MAVRHDPEVHYTGTDAVVIVCTCREWYSSPHHVPATRVNGRRHRMPEVAIEDARREHDVHRRAMRG